MSRFKAPKGAKKRNKVMENLRGLLPCGFLILSLFALLMMLFYLVLKSSS